VKKFWNWSRRGREHAGAAKDAHAARISLVELERALATVEPAARLVPPRLLRRVVRRHTSLPGIGFRVPHSKTYVIPQADLWEIADRSEISFDPGVKLPETIILLERPDVELLEQWSRGEVLLYYWQLLFHAWIHGEFHRVAGDRHFDATHVQQRLTALGNLEFDEIRNVLLQERFLLPPYDDGSAYIEFAAVYLGIRYFQPYLMASFFPALQSLETIDAIIAQDIDAGRLLEATRLPGTPEPEELREAAREAAEAFDADPLELVSDYQPAESHSASIAWARGRHRSESKYLQWSQRAEYQAARGNLAGAAIRRARAEFWAPRERAAEAATALRNEIHRLVQRLQAALGTEGDEARPWRESLLALAHQTPRGIWTVEARLIYDLQKVCVDQARTTSTIDVMQWVLTFGRRPIRRDLPNQRLVLVTRHLRSAQRRLPSVRISERQRRQLAEVLGAATKLAEDLLRKGFRPKIAATLDEVGLLPQNLVEVISRNKLVEELLDRIVERGFLTMGEVRDAVSRNHLKEPDCAGPGNFIHGDAVLRLDRRLAVALDGVYERGDFYLRWIQRFSLVAFGTFVGRCLTKYVVMPFGGAVVILVVVEHLVEMVTGDAPAWLNWKSYEPTLLVGSLLFGLIHVPRFRNTFWKLLKLAGKGLRLLFVDSLRWCLNLPLVQRLLHLPLILLLFRYLCKPLLPTLVLWLVLLRRLGTWPAVIEVGMTFLLLNILINSQLGRNAEEALIDWTVENWHRFGVRFFVGLFWWFVDLFRRMMQLIERLMYAVDEWLRFKSGQSRRMMVVKGALGTVWFFIAFVIRFCVNLLIEPQLNPVKHVPWVTVSHKILAPMWIAMDLHGFLAARMDAAMANVMTFLIVTLTPGIFGFLVWELKENWRLFAANRSKTLDPVLIGSHGESLPRLLKPGLHSGTVPKRFARLRRAEWKAALAGGEPRAVRKHREVLHHIENDLHRYIEREFIAWYGENRGWLFPQPRVERVHLATNSLSMELTFPEVVKGPLSLTFEFVDGRIYLAISGKPCEAGLTDSARTILRMTIVNVLKTGGVDMLEHGEKQAAVDDGPQSLEVGSQPVLWSQWVVSWNAAPNALQDPPWDRLLVP
jgi:hypothetical protein